MKKAIALLISALLILSLFAACGSKGETPVDKTSTDAPSYEYTHRDIAEPLYIEAAEGFAGGTGSEADPYQISDASELMYMQQQFNNPEKELNNAFDDAYYVLTADIVLNDVSSYDTWATTAPEYSWKTISATGEGFVFDGNGHTISGMYINADNEKGKEEYGLFGTLGGTVKNLNIDKAYISVSGATNYVGAIAGYLRIDGMVDNCNVNATIDCYDNDIGGVIGHAAGGFVTKDLVETDEVKLPVISNCTFSGEINQIKKESLNIIGGIVGSGGCDIVNCTNNGNINFGGKDIEKAGGIIGMASFGKIEGCVNNGNINCEIDENATSSIGSVAGGIAGDAFLSSTGGEHASKGINITKCVNNGKVSAQMNAGGIAGEGANSHNDWCLVFEECKNTGEVTALDNIGGIVGSINCESDKENGAKVAVEYCENTADLTGATPGGIIGTFMISTGYATVLECKNSGNVTATKEQNAGGIIGYWLGMKSVDAKVDVTGCENSGKIESTLNAGGIFGFAGNDGSSNVSSSSFISVTDCKNSGEVVSNNYNGFVGGIAGNWGMKDLKTEFVRCINSGNLAINGDEFDEETASSEVTFTLSRICGGIVGRIGSGLFLTTDTDETKEKNINKENPVIYFSECSNTGKFEVADEEKYEFENGKAVYENYFGGIVGNTCAESGFSIFVEDCTYTNYERGLGNTDLPDIGEKK